MDEYRQHLRNEIPAEAVDLFATFSRFEFALKRGGFLAGGIDDWASPNWTAFANALGVPFLQAMQAAPEAQIFFDEPPLRLERVADDDVAFRPRPPVNSTRRLLDAVKLVRNNLFHGDKAAFRPRDRELIQASLFVLDSAMAACEQIEECRRVPRAFVFAAVNDA